MYKLTHINSNGDAIMVDISNKDITSRIAQASGTINMSREAFCAIIEGTVKKGDALSVARIAGIMAAKKTYSLIPLCHQIPLSCIKVEILPIKDEYAFRVISTVKTDYKTGVEMEALTAVNIALLTIYDMAKAIDKGMIISNIHLIKKSGGKSGTYTNE